MNDLLKRYNRLGLEYLDFDGYNEVEFHDNNETYKLYEDMFDEFIAPVFDRLEDMQFDSYPVTFNFFCTDNDGTVWAEWYEPQIRLEVSNEDYSKEIEQGIELITK